jgi:hypothetical protein
VPWQMGSLDYEEFVGSHQSRSCDSEDIVGRQLAEPCPYRFQGAGKPRGTRNWIQEGIGLAIDHTNQRAFTTELGGNVRVASLHANTLYTTVAKLGILTGIAYVA